MWRFLFQMCGPWHSTYICHAKRRRLDHGRQPSTLGISESWSAWPLSICRSRGCILYSKRKTKFHYRWSNSQGSTGSGRELASICEFVQGLKINSIDKPVPWASWRIQTRQETWHEWRAVCHDGCRCRRSCCSPSAPFTIGKKNT